MSLVLHELATNALKYGAWSVAGGCVTIGWQVDEATQDLRLSWQESGGPPATAPSKTGFGTRLIDSTVSYSLHGCVKRQYPNDGLQIEIAIPLRETALADQ